MTTKNLVALAICGVIACSLISCANSTSKSEETSEIANPWTDCSDLYEASQNAGFEMTVPDSVGDYTISAVQNMGQEIIQVIYSNKNDEENFICIRKGVGSDDISGDYNTYKDTYEVEIGDVTVYEKGKDSEIFLITWTNEDYSYSISVPGMTAYDVYELVQLVK